MKPAVLLLALFSGLTPALAEDDEDSIESITATRTRNGSDANPEIKDFVGGVYEGKAGSYWSLETTSSYRTANAYARWVTTTSRRRVTTARSATPSSVMVRPQSNQGTITFGMEPQRERWEMPCLRLIRTRTPRARCAKEALSGGGGGRPNASSLA